jgi:hypothetical protein
MDELELIRSFRRDHAKPNPVARAAARDRLLAHIADGSPRRVSKGKIFVCYRHEDSWAYAGWLVDALARQFGKDRVFRGIDSQRGVDFRDQADEAIDSCAVLLAVIGPKWLRVQDESGRRRIDHPRDLVALEIATALKRDIRVIPVLVGGVRMPRESDLPELLAELAYRTAIELSDAGWDHQISGLVDDLRQVFESTAGRYSRAALPSVRSLVPAAARQDQLDVRGQSIGRGISVVSGDAPGAGGSRLHEAQLPDLQRAVASMPRMARLARRLGLALLRSQVFDPRIGRARDGW